MQFGKLRDRIVLGIPSLVANWLLELTFLVGLLAGGFSGIVSPFVLGHAVRLALRTIGVGDDLANAFAVILSLVVLVVFLPGLIIAAITYLPDLQDKNEARSKYRLLHLVWTASATFIMQMFVVPGILGDLASIQVCMPTGRYEVSGFWLRFFLFGLIEVHTWLLVVMWRWTSSMLLRVLAAQKPRSCWDSMARWVAKWWLRGALVTQALLVLLVPADVQLWWPVFGKLCTYPTELVLTVYANIALSIGMKIRHWRTSDDDVMLEMLRENDGVTEEEEE